MELIRFNKNDKPVSIDIQVEEAPIWSYIYVGDLTFKSKSSAGGSSKHTLGLPVNLDDDINSWDIRLGNISKSALTATVTITWMQDNQVLNVWTRQIDVPAEAAAKVSDDALLEATT